MHPLHTAPGLLLAGRQAWLCAQGLLFMPVGCSQALGRGSKGRPSQGLWGRRRAAELCVSEFLRSRPVPRVPWIKAEAVFLLRTIAHVYRYEAGLKFWQTWTGSAHVCLHGGARASISPVTMSCQCIRHVSEE